MISDIMKGAVCLGRGFRIMRQPGVRIYAVVPLLINLVLFASLIWFGYEQFSPLVDYMMSWVPAIFNFLRWVIWIVISTFTAIFIFFTFTPIANIVAAPFNALLSEKIEIKLTGKAISANSSFMQMARDSFLSQIRKLIYIISWSAVLLLISLIPLVNFAAPFLWVIFGSWLLSLEYLDYPMGNHELNFTRQRQILAARKGLSLGFGSSVMVLTSIPLLNFIVMPVAVAGATVLWVEQLEAEM
ncbi:MAG: sulfate transporter CysZ [Gammaproteobacteria bacterium]|nr:MAG: sulfate transporter CysZ [Gammaproteobacteria bacterium]